MPDNFITVDNNAKTVTIPLAACEKLADMLQTVIRKQGAEIGRLRESNDNLRLIHATLISLTQHSVK